MRCADHQVVPDHEIVLDRTLGEHRPVPREKAPASVCRDKALGADNSHHMAWNGFAYCEACSNRLQRCAFCGLKVA